MSNSIGTLASSIFVSEFDSDTSLNNIISISGWLQGNIGLLNTNIYRDFSGSNPALEDEENAIFTQLYLHQYYVKQARASLRTAVSASGGLSEVTEGDTTVRFASRGEVGKTYRGIAKDCYSELQRLIHAYNMYEARPRQVGGEASSTS